MLLAGLAGYVDAVGFLSSGGYFVSFMSGNSTRLGVGLGEGTRAVGLALLLILSFLSGTVGGALLRRCVRPAAKEPAVLVAVAAVLMLAAATFALADRFVAMMLIASAMGAMNLAFEVDGDVRVGITYMTGTLVKLGIRVAEALTGGPRWNWFPYLLLWGGLVAGGALGALVWVTVDGIALWMAAAYAALVAGGVSVSRLRN
ncbi:YoaK family protein [Croceicoccus bisphenolivorans]|uniref:YoaK family protein n=1 Tax=Croceicoccus bisphenolivorans TaxID=1783232 RepID=UPI000B2638A2|nr:DUF1275 family protein [Croceicoccus bisphenolivorans]